MQRKVLAFVLAGGKGTRLYPLTRERAKPAVPFGGRYRIVDFVLSNLVNSGIYSIYVLTQFKSQSLLQHLSEGWSSRSLLQSQFIIPVPAQMRAPGETWYRGTADAIYQNMNLIEQAAPDVVCIFGADHIYRMNIRQMIEHHFARNAEVTVAGIELDKQFSADFSTLETDEGGQITAFHEKGSHAPHIPGKPDRMYASMGNYVFSAPFLLRELKADAARESSHHHFERDILPSLIGRAAIYAYNFADNSIPGDPAGQPSYWRDAGTVEAYYEANMDLRSLSPRLNLYNRKWPLRTAGFENPPARFLYEDETRQGRAVNSIVSGGTVIAGGVVRNSVIGCNCIIHEDALVEDSILFDNTEVGQGAKIRRSIIGKNSVIANGTEIGYNPESDRKLYTVSESGIVLVVGRRSPVNIATMDL